jgi:hypothetical protein
MCSNKKARRLRRKFYRKCFGLTDTNEENDLLFHGNSIENEISGGIYVENQMYIKPS